MSGARVKPLVWRGKNGCFRGDSADGTCYAANEISPARWMLDRHGGGASVVIGNDFPTLAKAAAAAQADYSARILSAIDTTAVDAERDALRARVAEMEAIAPMSARLSPEYEQGFWAGFAHGERTALRKLLRRGLLEMIQANASFAEPPY